MNSFSDFWILKKMSSSDTIFDKYLLAGGPNKQFGL